jgi:hypothetical protein
MRHLLWFQREAWFEVRDGLVDERGTPSAVEPSSQQASPLCAPG